MFAKSAGVNDRALSAAVSRDGAGLQQLEEALAAAPLRALNAEEEDRVQTQRPSRYNVFFFSPMHWARACASVLCLH